MTYDASTPSSRRREPYFSATNSSFFRHVRLRRHTASRSECVPNCTSPRTPSFSFIPAPELAEYYNGVAPANPRTSTYMRAAKGLPRTAGVHVLLELMNWTPSDRNSSNAKSGSWWKRANRSKRHTTIASNSACGIVHLFIKLGA